VQEQSGKEVSLFLIEHFILIEHFNLNEHF